MSEKIYKMVTDQIIKQLESVNLYDFKTPWFCVGHSPVNIRGTAYRGINHLLLSSSGHQSNLWGTFKQWQDKDCHVMRGEKSQAVVKWTFFKETGEDGQATGKTNGVSTRYFRVFNSDQVEGDYVRAREQQLKDKLLAHDPITQGQSFVSAYLEAERLPLRDSDRAYYASGIREHIGMPQLGQFRDPNQYYSTFAHEITHSTGNKNRLDRDMQGRFGTNAYAFEELVAELGSAFVCGSLGLEQSPRLDHVRYIKGWLSCLKDDPKFIISAASHAQKAADYALAAAGMLEEQPQTQTA